MGYATTVVFSDLKVTTFKNAAKGTKWVKDFSLLEVAWRVTVKPHETRRKPRVHAGPAEEVGYIEVDLELVQPGCVVELKQLDAQLLGLGHSVSLEHQVDLTFSTVADDGEDLETSLGTPTHEQLGRFSLPQKSGVSPGDIPTGGLEVLIEMRPKSRPRFPYARPLPPADPQQTLQGLMANLYDAAGGLDAAAMLPDVTLKFSGMHVKAAPVRAHSFVMSLRSPVFRTQFHGAMASKGPPFTCNVPEEVNPTSLALLLRYFYTDALGGVTMTFSDAAALLSACEYYEVPCLALICDHSLELALSADTALDTLQLAHRYRRNELRAAALRSAAEHVDALLDTPAWAQLPAPLQHAVVRTVSNHGVPASIKEEADAEPERAAKRTRA